MHDFNGITGLHRQVLAGQERAGLDLRGQPVADKPDEARIEVAGVLRRIDRLGQGEPFRPGNNRIDNPALDRDESRLAVGLLPGLLLAGEKGALRLQPGLAFGIAPGPGKQ